MVQSQRTGGNLTLTGPRELIPTVLSNSFHTVYKSDGITSAARIYTTKSYPGNYILDGRRIYCY